jgi:hypothetical protein
MRLGRWLVTVSAAVVAGCAPERTVAPRVPAPAPRLGLAGIPAPVLIVLDGVVLPPGSAARRTELPAAGIRSVEVLKDSTAVARFGAQAAAGAVVITSVTSAP